MTSVPVEELAGPRWLKLSPVMATPRLLPGDRVRAVAGPVGQSGIVFRRCWFGKSVIVYWGGDVFTRVPAGQLVRSDAR